MTTVAAQPPLAAVIDRPRAAVDAHLARFVAAQVDRLVRLDPGLEPLAQTASAAVLGGGKRLRPVFAYWGWRGAGGADVELARVVSAFAALEMLHAFALVHDDVMDDADVRRGRPSAHAALAARQRHALRDGAAQRFGVNAAILVGDLCLVWADQLLADAAVPATTVLRAREVYDAMRVETIAGQFLDVLGEASTVGSLRRAEQVVRLKTAAYTVVRPLQFGSALAATDAAALDAAYARYGAAVGEAYQLRDDLLDGYGDPAHTGKPTGGDFARGRPTVLLELARQLASPAQRAELDRSLHGGNDPARVAALVTSTGAPVLIEQRIAQRATEAIAALDAAPLDPTTRAALAELALVATERTT